MTDFEKTSFAGCGTFPESSVKEAERAACSERPLEARQSGWKGAALLCLKGMATASQIFLLISINSFAIPLVQAQGTPENVQLFGPASVGSTSESDRNLANCLSRLRRFLSPPNADIFEDVADYFRDFSLLPSHYADVAAIENQVNKSRYAVIAAFLRCDLNRLPAAINAYEKLEAELYFVRHFVNTDGGYIHDRTLASAEKQQFLEQMLDYIFIRHPREDEDRDRAKFEGYFDQFIAQYRERGKGYANFGEDPVYSELSERVDKLVQTLSSLGTLVGEVANLGKDVGENVSDAASAVKQAAVSAYERPGAALVGALENAVSRFQICPAAGDPEDCKDAIGLYKSAKNAALGVENFFNKTSERKTFEEVKVAISQAAAQEVEATDKGAMLARYELLYAQVNGDGVAAVMANMDGLLNILGPDGKFGSLPPLKQIAECAEDVKKRECK